eukprot:473698-Prorocentrum_minimum.AAC.1
MQLALVLPLTSVPCECGFSRMKLIKSSLRNRIGHEALDHLMRISMAAYSCVEFMAKYGTSIVQKFFQMRKRRAWNENRTGKTQTSAMQHMFEQE